MRLSQIKLAGFKSFVDPTIIHLPGQIVGVVGPNGCGKSNVIDALRWVLGESKASALRGGSMQDVIFNGSSRRKPVSRASVELVFDNSLGKAAGQWSSYAEIAIKRVLQRDGKSGYYINNQQVRRKDITDIFLGTGLGARAYAIIEQGMISRIIEAKPDELRVFLEEAAGVSRYRDRRRETENRIRDTRDNLLRVADVMQELSARMAHLAEQAKVALVYRQLSEQRSLSQHYFWILKKQEALAQKQDYARCAEQTRLALEAETTRLREIELALESRRTEHYQLSDELHQRQGEMYQVNADLTRFEQQIKHVSEQQQRLDKQIQTTETQLQQRRSQLALAQEQLIHWQVELEQGLMQQAFIQQRVEELRDVLPEAEVSVRLLQDRYNELLREEVKCQQQARLFESQLQQFNRQIQALEAKLERMVLEQQSLLEPDSALVLELKQQLLMLEAEQSEYQQQLEDILAELPIAEQQRSAQQILLQQHERLLAQTEARLIALTDLQNTLAQSEALQSWLQQLGMGQELALWQLLRVEQGWESALESVLGVRLNALPLLGNEFVSMEPPAKQAFYQNNIAVFTNQSIAGLTPLLSLINCQQHEINLVLQHWLADVYIVDDLICAQQQLALLPDKACLVTKQGHIVDQVGVVFHAAEAGQQGVLARQNEIESLMAQQSQAQLSLVQMRRQQQELSEVYQRLSQQELPLRNKLQQIQQQQQQLNMALFKQEQMQLRYKERTMQLQQEQSLVQNELQELLIERELCWAEQAALQTGQMLSVEIEQLSAELALAEQQLHTERQQVQQAQHALQEAGFLVRNCQSKIIDFEQQFQLGQDEIIALQENLLQLQSEVVSQQNDEMQQTLQQYLAKREQADAALRTAREALEQATTQLQTLDQARLSCEQSLNPLRDQLNSWVLKKQEARLMFEQWSEQLVEVDEPKVMLEMVSCKDKAPQLAAQVKRLDGQIAALGAVNLAALDELDAARDRLAYLEAQSEDLNGAMLALEEAIRRIDKESRNLLMDTYNQVNKHLAEKFPILFNGGEARLELLGDEILDSGVQVMAQPPGKKNSSIHLMSGGEKALTAIALVFSLFQLNPAPFCLLDEVDAPLDDANTERLCALIKTMAQQTQFIFISHNKITMELAEQLIGVTMQEQGVSKVVSVDIEQALDMRALV